jgi:hypothetical protein
VTVLIDNESHEASLLGGQWDSSSGTVTRDTSQSHNGAASAYFDNTGTSSFLQKALTGKAATCRLYFRIKTDTSSANNLFQASNANGDAIIALRAGRLLRASVGATNGTATSALNLNQWYRIDVKVDSTGASTVLTWTLDGSAQSGATRSQTSVAFSNARVGLTGTSTAQLYIDGEKLTDSTADYPIGAWLDAVMADTTSVTESVSRTAQSFARTGADTITTVSESLARAARSVTRTASDTVSSLSESVARTAQSFARTATDTVTTVTESLARAARSVSRTAADTLATVSESVSRTAQSFTRTTTDTVTTVSESLARGAQSLSRTASDTVNALTETVTRSAQSLVRTSTDTIAAPSETFSRSPLSLVRLVSDAPGVLSEAFSRTLAFARAATDTTSVSDSMARALLFARAQADTLSPLTDTTARDSQAFTRDVADSPGVLSEAFSRAMSFVRTLVDTTAVSEAVSRVVSFTRTAADTLPTLDEIIEGGRLLVRAVADTVATLSDSFTRNAQNVVRTAADTLTTSDAFTRSLSIARTVTDTVPALTESLVRGALARVRGLVDTLAALSDHFKIPTRRLIGTATTSLRRSGSISVTSGVALTAVHADTAAASTSAATGTVAASITDTAEAEASLP